jgi:hypothetical protein
VTNWTTISSEDEQWGEGDDGVDKVGEVDGGESAERSGKEWWVSLSWHRALEAP